MVRNLFVILIFLLLGGCTTIDNGDRYGVEIWEHFTDISPEKVNRLAREHCQMYGKQAQLDGHKSRSFLESEYDKYRFRCIETPVVTNPIFQPPLNNRIDRQSASQPASMSIESATKKCEEIGFKLGTESFGNCVLKLSK